MIALVAVLANIPRTRNKPELIQDIGSAVSFLGILAAASFLALRKMQRCMAMLSLDIVFSLLSVGVTLIPLVAVSDKSYNWSMELAHLSQLFISHLFAEPWQFIPLYCLTAIWELSVIFTTPALQLDANLYLVNLGVTFAFKTALSFSQKSHLLQEARAAVRERDASRTEAILSDLLSMMCDAVVSLSSDLCFRRESDRFSAWVFNGQKSLLGESFTRFLAEDDTPRFEEFIRNSKEEGAARSLHVHIIDCSGLRMPVQLFHARIVDDNDEEIHQFGLRDDSLLERARRSHTADTGAGVDVHQVTQADLPPGLAFTIRTKLDWTVEQESPASQAALRFKEEPSVDRFLSRFRQPQLLLRWLEFLHVTAACGNTSHGRMNFGKAFFVDSAGVELQAEIRARVLAAPESLDAAEDPERFDFEPKIQFVDLELRLLPVLVGSLSL